jgi:hypothetical protein
MEPRVPVVGSIQKKNAKQLYSYAWNIDIAFTKHENMLQTNSFHLLQACSEWVQGDFAMITRPKMANKSNNPVDGVAPE